MESRTKGSRTAFLVSPDAYFVIVFFFVIVVGVFLAVRWREQHRDTDTVALCTDTGCVIHDLVVIFHTVVCVSQR